MNITKKIIIDRLIGTWPDMEEPWIYDKKLFYAPPLRIIQRALDTSLIPDMEIIDEFNDCDDIALHFLSEFRRKQYIAWVNKNLKIEDRYPSAIGIVFGIMFRGVEEPHQVNVAICEDIDGVVLVDAFPGVKRAWKADPANDIVIKLAYM